MKNSCLYLVLSNLLVLVGLAVATVFGSLYVRLVQKNACYQYARQQNLPDLEYLQFTSVVIATNQFHGHVCNFTDTRTGFPVSVAYDEDDIPVFADTMQVLAGMVLPLLCFVVIGAIILDGVFLKTRQRRASFPPQ